ncbi:MAG: ABC transporter ATP-binding protein [Halanaerobiales bacterium]
MIKVLKRMNKREWYLTLLSIVFIIGQVWLELRIPEYMSTITTFVQTPGSKVQDILFSGSMMILAALGSLIAAFIVGFLAAQIAARFSKQLRESIFSKVLIFSKAEISNFSTASLITRSTNDITQIQMIIAIGLQAIVKAPIMATWALTKIAGKSWQWSLVTAFAIFIIAIVLIIISVFAVPKFKIIQKLTDSLNRVTRENITGVRVVRADNAENHQQNKFEEVNEPLTDTHLFVNRIIALIGPTMSFVMSSLTLVIYWTGAYIISNANMMDRIDIFSNMVVFSAYAVQVIMSFMMLIMIFVFLPRAMVSARRINEVLETKLSIKDGIFDVEKTQKQGSVEFRNVSFKYSDSAEYVLKEINFIVNKGETIAIIGSTGSGKSTLVDLIPRFFDVTTGEVLVDGINVKNYRLKDLRNKLGYVSQEAILFSGNVLTNVAYGKETFNEKLVQESVEIAQAQDFIEKMEGKYKGNIARGGTNVSGGQKQRLAIARAIYKNPEVFIFDDSFSALDFKTEKDLRKRLFEKANGTTNFIVAQRIGSIKNADRIIVLENGEIVGIGSHEQLLKECQTYIEIAQSQLSEEELKNE